MTAKPLAPVEERSVVLGADAVRAVLDGRKTMYRVPVRPQPHQSVSSGWSPDTWFWPSGRSTAWMNGERVEVTNRKTGETVVSERHVPVAEWLTVHHKAPFKVGMKLWVKEKWRPEADWVSPSHISESFDIRYAADQDDGQHWMNVPHAEQEAWTRRLNRFIDGRDRRWRSAQHLPRWASRLTLEVTGVKVDRVQDVSEADAIAEGVKFEIPIGAIPELQKFPDGFEGWTEQKRDAWFLYTARATYMAQCVGASNAVEAFAKTWDRLHGRASWPSNPWVWAITFKLLTPDREVAHA